MESFYGGRPGNSFIIVESFSSIDEMTRKFQQGMNYNKVYFDQYVIINNPNDSRENGKVYRRGYDLSNGLGGAEYVCSIQGPAGKTPTIELIPYDEIDPEQIENTVYGNVPYGVDIQTNSSDEKSAIEYIPGFEKGGDGEPDFYNDNIQFKYYQVEDAANNQSLLKIGFKIPYPVIDFTVERANSNEAFSIERIDNQDHNFYSKWQLNIPFPVKGDSVTKIEVIKLNSDEYITNEDINYDWYNGDLTVNDKKDKDQDNKNSIIVATIEKEDGTSTRYYVADFDIIQNIDINENGYAVFTLNGETISSNHPIVPLLNGINIDDDGTLSMEWYNANGSESKKFELENKIQWIKNISVENGKFYVTWNTPEKNEENVITSANRKEEISIENTKLITDLRMKDGSLYESHLGISNERQDDPSQYIEINNTLYKKCLNIEQQIENMINKKLQEISNKLYYKKGEIISGTFKTDLIVKISKIQPHPISFECQLKFDKLVPPEVDVIQYWSKIIKNINNGIYNTGCVRKVYLAPPNDSTLNTIYPPNDANSPSNPTQYWRDLNASIINSDESNFDELISFYSGSQGSASQAAFFSIVTDGIKLDEDYDNKINLRKQIIKELIYYVLTGDTFSQDDSNFSTLIKGTAWTVQQQDGYLNFTKLGSSGFTYTFSEAENETEGNFITFTIPIVIGIDWSVQY